MKKIITIISLIVLALFIVACTQPAPSFDTTDTGSDDVGEVEIGDDLSELDDLDALDADLEIDLELEDLVE
jgi:PBP1b-binding outer membrane lipoprotein LpoB